MFGGGFYPTPNLKKLMIFIDGGYLRETLEKYWNIKLKNDPKRFATDISLIADKIPNYYFCLPHISLETIRIYYYDGTVASDDPIYPQYEQFFDALKSNYSSQSPLEDFE